MWGYTHLHRTHSNTEKGLWAVYQEFILKKLFVQTCITKNTHWSVWEGSEGVIGYKPSLFCVKLTSWQTKLRECSPYSAYLSIHSFTWVSIHLSVHPSIHPSYLSCKVFLYRLRVTSLYSWECVCVCVWVLIWLLIHMG